MSAHGFSESVAGSSHAGPRESNQDSYAVASNEGGDVVLLVVADGVGGQLGGELASSAVTQHVRERFHDEIVTGGREPDRSWLESLFESSKNAVIERTERSEAPGLSPKTTLVVAVIVGRRLLVAHVGDSRIYRLDERALTPLTTDHSMVAEFAKREGISEDEAAQLYGKNVITRALGVRESVAVDYRLLKVSPGQVFVMCSDGLCGYVEDIEIFEVANRARKSTDHIVNDLIQMANDRGGPDNVTVIAFEIKEVGESNYNDLEPATLPEESDELLAIEDGWVRRLQDYEAAQTEKTVGPTGSDGSGKSKTWMGLIFAVFVVVAIALIYFLAGSD